MKDNKPLFGTKPKHLDQLVSDILRQSEEDETHEMSELPSASVAQSDTRIGPYRLLELIGEGGMGLVYLAQQEHPIQRQVALKVIKPGMDSARVIARFEAERQALALLDHPNIAHIYEAGTTEAGRPYFVMEHVKGLPISEHCDHYKLTVEHRLRLFQQVCQAVHHAHQKGIIHRDLKPSNILVSLHEDQSVPIIIDFGVAKAVTQPLTERTLYTEQGRLFGTPEYMSPEQADMAVEDVDTRSDIYSLGVLLYELLTGVMPFDDTTFRKEGIDHIRQMIREADPKTPSTRLTGLGDEAKKIAKSRQTDAVALTKRLHKELEWIPLRAMRKERSERYQSASELTDDIGNYLNGAALMAGPPSALYRLKKSMRRNRALVTGVVVVLVVLTAGVMVSTLSAMRAARQARISKAVTDFLREDLLGAVNPLKGGQRDASLESILDIGTERLEGRFEEDPLIEASIRYTIGITYILLGKYEAAEPILNRAIGLRRGTLGTIDLETLLCMHELGWAYWKQGRFEEAELILTEVVAGMRGILSEVDKRLLMAISCLAWTHCSLGQYEQAERLQAAALEIVQRRLGSDHAYVPNHMEGLAGAYRGQGDYEKAAELCRKALDISIRNHGEKWPETAYIRRFFASIYKDLGRYPEALEMNHKALETWRELATEEHPDTLICMSRQALIYRQMEQYEEAEQLLLQAEEIAHRVFGNDSRITYRSIDDLITLYEAWDKPEKVEKWQMKLSE